MSSSNDNSSSSQGEKLTDSELVSQVKLLEDVLKNASSADDEAIATNNNNLAELLKQLDDAGDIAQGVEDKLDKLLGDLETMIGELEQNKDQNTG